MRSLLVLVPALALALGVSACASPGEAPSPAATPGTSTAEPTEAPLTVRIDSLKLSVDSLRYTVAIGYPQLVGAPDAVNRTIRDSVEALAEEFRPVEAPAPDARQSEVYEVDGSTVETFLESDVFSALVEVYAYTGGAHGNTFYAPVNVDLTTGTSLGLGDLFQPGTAWADTLSAIVAPVLVAQAAAGSQSTEAEARTFLYPEGYNAESIRSTVFTLDRDSLALHFVPYQVAAYAFGTFRVPVAYSDLDAILRPTGPVARLRSR